MNHELRLPPQNVNAERSALSCVMLNNASFDTVASLIGATDFYVDIHSEIWRALCDLHEAEKPFDPVTMAYALDSRGTLEDIGGPPYLNEINETLPSGGLHNAVYYAGIVAEMSNRRRGIGIARKLIEDCYRGEEDAADAVASAAERMKDGRSARDKKARPESEYVAELIDDFERGISPVKFDGIKEIDEQIGGTANSEMIVIGAPTSHAKTLLAKQWLNTASANGVVCGIISEEMSTNAMARRSLAYMSPVQKEDWMARASQLRLESRDYYSQRAPIILAEKCHTIGAAELQITDMVRKHGANLIAVDYAQLLKGEGSSKPERVADVALRIKHQVMKHDIRIILLSGFNRKIYERDDPDPELSDLAETTEIEKSADVVLLLFHPFRFNNKYPDPREFRIFHAKGRSGGIHKPLLHMSIDLARQRLVEYQKSYEPPESF